MRTNWENNRAIAAWESHQEPVKHPVKQTVRQSVGFAPIFLLVGQLVGLAIATVVLLVGILPAMVINRVLKLRGNKLDPEDDFYTQVKDLMSEDVEVDRQYKRYCDRQYVMAA